MWPGTTPIAETPATGSVPPGIVSSSAEDRAGGDDLAAVADPDRALGLGHALVHRDGVGMRDLVEGEVTGRLEGVLVRGGQALGLAHARALRWRQTRKPTRATTPTTAAAGPTVEITRSAVCPRK